MRSLTLQVLMSGTAFLVTIWMEKMRTVMVLQEVMMILFNHDDVDDE